VVLDKRRPIRSSRTAARRAWPRVPVASGLAILLLLGGCSSDPQTQPTPDTKLPSFIAKQSEKKTEQQDVAAFYVKYNEIMKSCMKEQGFDYLSYVPTTDKKIALGLSDQQFAEQYGYGISTLIDFLAPGSQRMDPNFKKMQGLDKAARQSFGKQFNKCQQKVQDEIGPPPSGGAIKMNDAEQKSMDGVQAKTNADPRVKQALATRAACLEKNGFTAGEDLTQPIATAAEKYVLKFENEASTMEAAGRTSDKLKIEDVLSGEELAELKKIQKREIAMAVETSPCQSEYDKVYKEVFDAQLQKLLRGEK